MHPGKALFALDPNQPCVGWIRVMTVKPARAERQEADDPAEPETSAFAEGARRTGGRGHRMLFICPTPASARRR
jgi:hypothetical protein